MIPPDNAQGSRVGNRGSGVGHQGSAGDPYSRLAPFLREYIYREKWSALRTIQEAAIREIFDSPDHLLIAAGTASGKTEAAFFPILSLLEQMHKAELPPGSPRGRNPRGLPLVLYISPLKALINDQAGRLEKILQSGRDSGGRIDIPLRRWHGDVPASHKNHFLENPRGILFITPESLEALLLRHPRALQRIFGALLFIVIDEVHVFMGSDRGSQLICQLARIEEAAENTAGPAEAPSPVRRIGLSATLGDYEGARRWLSQGSSLGAALVSDNAGRKISIALDYSLRRGSGFYQSLYAQCRNKRAIIFTNSRLEAEECSASLRRLALSQGEADIFRVHHGNLSALLRNEAEEKLKTGEGPSVTCATATLELGIDIGSLDRIIQLGPPWSVSAFVQRLGRSGRRSGRSEMYFTIADHRNHRVNGNSMTNLPDPSAIPWELLRTMAVIQLYIEEKWIEPPEDPPLPYSLLIHQCLAILASLGEHSIEDLTRRLLSLPPFRKRISPEDFRTLIAWLVDCDLIQKTAEGLLILGLEGERIVNRHNFYSVFPGNEEFRVILEGREIGTVNFVPDPFSVLAVGGKHWIVKSIDAKRREIWVGETSDEGSERLWRGKGGNIHRRIVLTIKRILEEDPLAAPPQTRYPYLSPAALGALEGAGRLARKLGLTDHVLGGTEAPGSVMPPGPSVLFLFPWTGSAGMRTIAAVLKTGENQKALRINFCEAEHDLYFRIETFLTLQEFRSALTGICQKTLDSGEITGKSRKDIPLSGKYDYLLPPDLLTKQYAANMLSLDALREFLGELQCGHCDER
jgi:ATP-dependent Lhr-like helicase